MEVKARAATTWGPASAAVDWRKRRRIGRAAALYLALRGIGETACRFDVLAIESVAEAGGAPRWRFRLLADAFQLG